MIRSNFKTKANRTHEVCTQLVLVANKTVFNTCGPKHRLKTNVINETYLNDSSENFDH